MIAVVGRPLAPRLHDRRHFYKYVTAEVAHIILATRTLRWSSPIIFDDPFDVPINLELPFTVAELQLAIAHRIAEMIESGAAMAHPVLRAIQQYVERIGRADVMAEIVQGMRQWPIEGVEVPNLEAIQAHWAQSRRDMRILCVSESPAIPPMWAHYAMNHRGVVLEFECNDLIDSPLRVARSVRYRYEPPRLATLEEWVQSVLREKPFDLAYFFEDYQYVKQTHWDYQQEWRVVSYKRQGETGLYSDWPFNARELTGVYLGSRVAAEELNTASALLRHGFEHVRLFRGGEDQRTLTVTFEEIQRA